MPTISLRGLASPRDTAASARRISRRLIVARSAPLGWLQPLAAGVVLVPEVGVDGVGIDGEGDEGGEGDEAAGGEGEGGDAELGADGSDTPLAARARLIWVTRGAQ